MCEYFTVASCKAQQPFTWSTAAVVTDMFVIFKRFYPIYKQEHKHTRSHQNIHSQNIFEIHTLYGSHICFTQEWDVTWKHHIFSNPTRLSMQWPSSHSTQLICISVVIIPDCFCLFVLICVRVCLLWNWNKMEILREFQNGLVSLVVG